MIKIRNSVDRMHHRVMTEGELEFYPECNTMRQRYRDFEQEVTEHEE